MDRRSFILSSLATIGTIATAKIAAAAELGTGASRASWETLYVENELGSMLSFDGRAADWEMRPWTWRMFLADKYHGNPDAKLSEAGLQYALSYMGIDDEDSDWREKLEKELDTLHPKSGELAGQEDEFRFETSPTARAYYLMKEIIDQQPEISKKATEEELGLWFQEDGLGVIAYIGDGKVEFLAEIIDALKLPIEVEEV